MCTSLTSLELLVLTRYMIEFDINQDKKKLLYSQLSRIVTMKDFISQFRKNLLQRRHGV